MRDAEWWPIALGGEIRPGKPAGFALAGEPIVLFRDGSGAVHALEDRCPHRRVPLSLGTVTEQGWLQCGYHGWSFDGATGKCMAIPSLRAGEKVPPLYGAFAYRAAELDGMIYVAARSGRDAPPRLRHPVERRVFTGRTMIGLAHEEYVAALLDGPQLLLRTAGLRIADTMISDARAEDGWLTTERAAFWTGQPRFDAFVREYRLILRLEVQLSTGEAWISMLTPDGATIARAHWCATPSARGVSALLWRSYLVDGRGLRARLLRAAGAIGVPPIAPRGHIDMAMVAALLPGPSDHWRASMRTTQLYGETLSTERARA